MNAHVSTEDLIKMLTENHDLVIKTAEENQKKTDEKLLELAGIKSQMTEIEQKLARRPRLAAASGDQVARRAGNRIREAEGPFRKQVKAAGAKCHGRRFDRNQNRLDHYQRLAHCTGLPARYCWDAAAKACDPRSCGSAVPRKAI